MNSRRSTALEELMRRILPIAVGMLVVIGACSAAAGAQTKVKVRFKPGTTTGNYSGSIRGERYLDYLIVAKRGQVLLVRLKQKAGARAYFNVQRSGSPAAISEEARETESWKGVLPEDGTYVIRVYMAKADRLSRKKSSFQVWFSVEVE
jgi:hypothetical protein